MVHIKEPLLLIGKSSPCGGNNNVNAVHGVEEGTKWIKICVVFHNEIKSTKGRKEGNVLFNDALNTFCLRLYGVRHMVKDHSDSEKGKERKCLI